MSAHSPLRFWLSGKRHAEQDHFFRQTLEAQGWQEGDEQHWEAAWVTGMPPKAAFKVTSPGRVMNHIPGNAALTVKSRLHSGLSALRERTQRHYGASHPHTQRLNFFPLAYEMPHDYPALLEDAAAHPEKRWILKPTNASKGQGVQVLRDPTTAPLVPNWLVQEYITNPHTIRGHKYVLRLYMLIASIDPLRVYLYDQGFAKLASAPWSPDDIDNPFSQLTNPDINALNLDAEVPVEFIDLDRYRHWLREQGHDDQALFNQLQDLATLTALSGAEAMRARSQEDGADPRGCYELIGLDCLVDDQLKAWILECNLSPSLGICAKPEHGGVVEEAVKGALVRDMITLTGLDQPPRDTQSFDAAALAAERERAGGFMSLYPNQDIGRYLPFIGLPSLADYRLASELTPLSLSFHGQEVSELIDGEQLALYHHTSGRYFQLNDSAALIWLLISEGEPIETVIDHLQAASGGQVDTQTLANDLWATLSLWWQHGLLAPEDRDILASGTSFPAREQPATWRNTLFFDRRRWSISAPQGPVGERITDALAPLLDADGHAPHASLHVLEGANGYCLTSDSRVISSRLHLDEIVPAITLFCLSSAALDQHLVVDIALLSGQEGHIACVLPAHSSAQALTTLQALAKQHGLALTRGARLSLDTPDILEPLNLPLEGTTFLFQERSHCCGLLWFDEHQPESSETLSSLTLLGALLPFAMEGDHGLSHTGLNALQHLSQRTRLASTEVEAITQWLNQTPLLSSSQAAV
ncbi:PqqD family peptide modification chaperone [Halomonas sp. ISL-60]|uniref:PqqD family peptide modification chaperone n=1 Tax=Halomonas sp. ISL-56 TaxID=2819149 RepID=UPI001BEB47CC|nr:PqqD family peptide modification chaperone [Halomonas sp. ISL-56]MBT2771413.1 PqqD family peptide modification chaperone [Halomonas sp. ISL-60]MBT2801522.1 PqqD family peptide modification chaperone [Halomonas sp. ISL-56]